LRFPEYIAFAVLITIFVAIALKMLEMRDSSVLFAIALALVPFVIFNQQIVSGRSLQPIHYQVFIGNYVAALAVFFTAGLLWWRRFGQGRTGPKLISVVLFLAAIGWGMVECHYTVRVLDWANERRDKALPVGKRIEEVISERGRSYNTTVMAVDGVLADELPSIAPAAVLWSLHQPIFSALDEQVYRERFFTFLYYLNADKDYLEKAIAENHAFRISLFGWGRESTRLTKEYKPITALEIENVLRDYEEFAAGFDHEKASETEIHFLIFPKTWHYDLTQIEKWYELDRGEVVADFVIIRTFLKPIPHVMNDQPIDRLY
jgi:hypothetical protein